MSVESSYLITLLYVQRIRLQREFSFCALCYSVLSSTTLFRVWGWEVMNASEPFGRDPTSNVESRVAIYSETFWLFLQNLEGKKARFSLFEIVH